MSKSGLCFGIRKKWLVDLFHVYIWFVFWYGIKRKGSLSCFKSISGLCLGIAKKMAVGPISCVNPICVWV